VTVHDNVLIVEDELDWCKIYEDVARSQGLSTIRTAHDLAGASELLDAMKFAVAFVDVGLDVADDRNIDGLRVLEKMRGLGDETAVIVVTGRSGMDVLPITRDAIKKYDAYDAVGKASLEPQKIVGLLTEGLEAYRKTTAERPAVSPVLRGGRDIRDWDHQMLRAVPISGGAAGLYSLLDRSVGRFLPLVPRSDGTAITLDQDTSVAHGAYWSRAIGAGLVVVFGSADTLGPMIEGANAGRPLLGRYHVASLLNSTSVGSAQAVVYSMAEAARHEFA
jgi:CheY-like chemotaxis protein